LGGAVQDLFAAKRYLHGLFFAHLTLEKLAKALWVKNSPDNPTPPKIHNIGRILEQANVPVELVDMKFFLKMNEFQIEGRYPEQVYEMTKSYTKKVAEDILREVEIKRQWLLNQI
jgi:HEPN domain-containing protein